MLLLQNEQHRGVEAFEISVPWEPSWNSPLRMYKVEDLQTRGRTMNFPVWNSTGEEPVPWFTSTPLCGRWEGER